MWSSRLHAASGSRRGCVLTTKLSKHRDRRGFPTARVGMDEQAVKGGSAVPGTSPPQALSVPVLISSPSEPLRAP